MSSRATTRKSSAWIWQRAEGAARVAAGLDGCLSEPYTKDQLGAKKRDLSWVYQGYLDRLRVGTELADSRPGLKLFGMAEPGSGRLDGLCGNGSEVCVAKKARRGGEAMHFAVSKTRQISDADTLPGAFDRWVGLEPGSGWLMACEPGSGWLG